MAKILDGWKLADKIKKDVREEVERLSAFGIDVGLGLLRVGDNPASKQYFLATLKACEKLGIRAFQFNLPESASTNEILNVVHSINTDERINGLLVLLPLPPRINARRVVNQVAPEKDVDGLGYLSIGRMAADESTFQIVREGAYGKLADPRFTPKVSGFLPCTPFGVIRLLEHYGVEMRGKHAVVVGKSLTVGKPLSLMLLAKEATVTVCHRETADLSAMTRQADIICSATGVEGLIRGDMIKEGAVVVDIGIKVLADGRITGDVDMESVEKKASAVTPVPGGVGPVTIAMLLENTVLSAHMSEAMKSPLMMG
ncbi:MAG: bifunctional methylenetetrahydrofolate dehydrogenase/methenyltetrahydrofolate cyclohydrolase FolD [Thermodesulfovibrionales bacterium]